MWAIAFALANVLAHDFDSTMYLNVTIDSRPMTATVVLGESKFACFGCVSCTHRQIRPKTSTVSVSDTCAFHFVEVCFDSPERMCASQPVGCCTEFREPRKADGVVGLNQEFVRRFGKRFVSFFHDRVAFDLPDVPVKWSRPLNLSVFDLTSTTTFLSHRFRFGEFDEETIPCDGERFRFKFKGVDLEISTRPIRGRCEGIFQGDTRIGLNAFRLQTIVFDFELNRFGISRTSFLPR